MRNIRIDSIRFTSTGNATIGINANEWGNLASLTNCMIDSHTTYGLYLNQCWDLNATNNWILNNTGHGVYIVNNSNNIRFDKNIIFSNSEDGVRIDSSMNVIITNCDFEGNLNNQINVTSTATGIIVKNSYFENIANGYSAINFVSNSTNVATIDSNYWNCSSASSTNVQTFLNVASGNNRITMSNLSFTNGSNPQYATFVNFASGNNACVANIPAGTSNPSINNSVQCRVYGDPYYETGLIAGDSTTQSLSATTWNPLACPNVQLDTKSEWNNSTYIFTPKDYGLYEFDFSVGVAMTSGDVYQIRLYDTASSYEYARYTVTAGITGTNSLQGCFSEVIGPSNTMQIQIYPPANRSTNPGGYNETWIRVHRID
jgi:parallel beta-helix repeat protein